MRRRNEYSIVAAVFDLLLETPFWVGPLLASTAFGVFRWLVPWMLGSTDPSDVMGHTLNTTLATISAKAAPVAGVAVIGLWVVAELVKWKRRLERPTSTLQSVTDLDQLAWDEFERLLAEAFQAEGYDVEHTGNAGPDGGVDLRLTKAGRRKLVQIKHWRKRQVGVAIVRELMGVVASESADGGVVVTSGSFTADAVEFAIRNPIELIDGQQLEKMILRIQSTTSREPAMQPRPDLPLCPVCGATMVRRTARRGPHTNNPFLGCSRFPQCRGTRQMV